VSGPIFTVGGGTVHVSDITDRATFSMPIEPEVLGASFRTGEIRQLVNNAPDPRRPVLVGKPLAVRVLGLQPGETPSIEADIEPLRWVRNREPQRAARRIRMARKRRRGWA
jgi:hypothetical protein